MNNCDVCNKYIVNDKGINECVRIMHIHKEPTILCVECISKLNQNQMETIEPLFNEPKHYHQYEIDTIDFLQKGFPPTVFKGFAIGSTIKYLHRYENKNGMEDLEKSLDYIKRLIEFHKEDHHG